MAKPSPSALPYRPCVGIMVVNRAGLVWIGHRANVATDAEGSGSWWQMPQGGIDQTEDPHLAALRELAEETGMSTVEVIGESRDWHTYDLPSHLVGVAWNGRYRGQRQKWFAMRFLGPDGEIDIGREGPGHHIEFDAWRWAPVNEVLSLIVPFKRDVYAAVLSELGPLARPE